MTELSDDRLVIVTGAAGRLGSALMALAPASVHAIGVDIGDGDLSTPHGIENALGPYIPEVVIHCAGYTDVEGATRDPQLAHRHNAVATANVARFCAEVGARLIYISSDYVFDGTKGEPYTENDAPNPVNPYGESKLAGERAAQEVLSDRASTADCLIVRTQWMFGLLGRNFVETIVRRAREGGQLRVVIDEVASPTYSQDLAGALWQIVARPVSGIVHITNSGYCTRAELARVALDAAGLAEAPISEITSAEWDSPTPRPAFSVLDNRRWQQLGFMPLRPWREAVSEYVQSCLAGQ